MLREPLPDQGHLAKRQQARYRPPDPGMVREAYMRLYNWSNLDIVASLRVLCDRLVLKGETQQVDGLGCNHTIWSKRHPALDPLVGFLP
jgi:hypothetical protein